MATFTTITIPVGETRSKWVRISGRTTQGDLKGYQGRLTSPDTVLLQFTNEDVGDNSTMQVDSPATLPNDFTYSQSATFNTTNFAGTYQGSFTWVRVVRTNTAQIAKVIIES